MNDVFATPLLDMLSFGLQAAVAIGLAAWLIVHTAWAAGKIWRRFLTRRRRP